VPYGPKIPDDELRARVRARLADGQLPAIISTNVYAGYGAGDICAACGDPITAQQIVYEVETPPLTLHSHCHQVWQLECLRRMSADTGSIPRRRKPKILKRKD